MTHLDPESLIATAAALARPFAPSEDVRAGDVAAALVTAAGNVYTGVCIDTACSLGFCAEHAAVAEMLKAREAHVRMIVAVGSRGQVIPPCGRCRELLWQLHPHNGEALVILGPDRVRPLAALLPER
ncbi:MAG TPA: cytidine deaminase [Longimicrobiaceae bacterium]|nr:cytidine deaminase [Longimicrobiaceae bacterium]